MKIESKWAFPTNQKKQGLIDYIPVNVFKKRNAIDYTLNLCTNQKKEEEKS